MPWHDFSTIQKDDPKFTVAVFANNFRIKKVANIIGSYKKKNIGVIVVSSAMSGATNRLIKKTKKFDDLGFLLNETWKIKRELSSSVTNSKI